MRIPIFVFLLFTGIACHAQQSQRRACLDELAQAPELAVLQSKAPVELNQQTFDMLTNTDKASGNELPAIKWWAQARDKCVALGADHLRTFPAGVANAVMAADVDFMVALADLYTGSLTYGEFARRRTELNNRLRAVVGRADDEYKRSVEQKNQGAAQEDAARRNAAFQMLLNSLQQQPVPYQPIVPHRTPTPRVTDCVPDGRGGMRCTTR